MQRADPVASVEVPLPPKLVAAGAAAIALGLAAAHVLLVVASRVARDNPDLAKLAIRFDLGGEGNLPNLYATVLLMTAAGLLLAIGLAARQAGGRDARRWLALGAIFAFLGLDEALRIHEVVSTRLGDWLGTSGYLEFVWVVPYGLATAAIAGLYLPFLLRLPDPTRLLFALAGALYVGGALGLEIAGGPHWVPGSEPSAAYLAFTTVEEVLELAGASLFVYALTDYLARAHGGLRITLAAQRPARAAR